MGGCQPGCCFLMRQGKQERRGKEGETEDGVGKTESEEKRDREAE